MTGDEAWYLLGVTAADDGVTAADADVTATDDDVTVADADITAADDGAQSLTLTSWLLTLTSRPLTLRLRKLTMTTRRLTLTSRRPKMSSLLCPDPMNGRVLQRHRLGVVVGGGSVCQDGRRQGDDRDRDEGRCEPGDGAKGKLQHPLHQLAALTLQQ